MAFWFLYHKMLKVWEHTFSDYFVFPFGKWDHVFFRTTSTTLFSPPHRNWMLFQICNASLGQEKGGKRTCSNGVGFPHWWKLHHCPFLRSKIRWEFCFSESYQLRIYTCVLPFATTYMGVCFPSPVFKMLFSYEVQEGRQKPVFPRQLPLNVAIENIKHHSVMAYVSPHASSTSNTL